MSLIVPAFSAAQIRTRFIDEIPNLVRVMTCAFGAPLFLSADALKRQAAIDQPRIAKIVAPARLQRGLLWWCRLPSGAGAQRKTAQARRFARDGWENGATCFSATRQPQAAALLSDAWNGSSSEICFGSDRVGYGHRSGNILPFWICQRRP
jgi:hypothetical protein